MSCRRSCCFWCCAATWRRASPWSARGCSAAAGLLLSPRRFAWRHAEGRQSAALDGGADEARCLRLVEERADESKPPCLALRDRDADVVDAVGIGENACAGQGAGIVHQRLAWRREHVRL